MKVRVVDDDGTTLAVDDSLDRLRETFGAEAEGPSGQIDDAAWNRPPTTDWDFGDLPAEVTVTRGGLSVSAYPAVIDQQDGVVVRLLDTPDRAQQESRRGIRRLYYLAEKKSLQAHVAWLPHCNETRLLASTLLAPRELDTQLALLIADRAFLGDEPLPRTKQNTARDTEMPPIEQRARSSRSRRWYTRCSLPVHAARLALEELPAGRFREAAEDVQRQLDELLPRDFLTDDALALARTLPRYLQAICQRLDKLRHGGQARDAEALQQLAPLLRRPAAACRVASSARHRRPGAGTVPLDARRVPRIAVRPTARHLAHRVRPATGEAVGQSVSVA